MTFPFPQVRYDFEYTGLISTCHQNIFMSFIHEKITYTSPYFQFFSLHQLSKVVTICLFWNFCSSLSLISRNIFHNARVGRVHAQNLLMFFFFDSCFFSTVFDINSETVAVIYLHFPRNYSSRCIATRRYKLSFTQSWNDGHIAWLVHSV